MSITFNNIPSNTRTPGVLVEIDNSQALQGLAENPHTALILGQKLNSGGSKSVETLQAITRENLANGFFGAGSELARMINVFKKNNPNTELFAMALSANGGVKASGAVSFSAGMSITKDGTWFLMLNGIAVDVQLTSGWSVTDCHSAVTTTLNTSTYSHVGMTASTNAGSDLNFIAMQSGTQGNYLNVRDNYFVGQSRPLGLALSTTSITAFAGGSVDPDLGDAWPIIAGTQYEYIIQPYIDAANLTEIEDELEDRFGPSTNLQGQGFTAVRATQASGTTLGNSRNSPHNCVLPFDDGPNAPEEWAAALGAQAAFNLNNDPARPLHRLELKGILPPPDDRVFTQPERNILLFDGMATFTSSVGKVLIERCITTYQVDGDGLPDASYLDVQTLATLNELRFQFITRMNQRYLSPRFKLADDSFPVQPGSFIARPKDIKQETISLFTLLRDQGLIENLQDFVDNLIVERNASDRNRVDVLLPPDLINQFRILAGLLQFIL
jgi:phage tail sheath gpL-like